MGFLLFGIFIVLVLLTAYMKTADATLKEILAELRRTRPVLDERPATPAPLTEAARVEHPTTSAADNVARQLQAE